jgi:hypothetical protein
VFPTLSVAPETVFPRPDVALPTVDPRPPTVLPSVLVTPPTVLPKVSPRPPRSPAIDFVSWVKNFGVGVLGTYGSVRWTWLKVCVFFGL